MADTDTQRRTQIRDGLLGLLADAADPDHYLTTSQVRQAGVPRRWVDTVSQASRTITTITQAAEAADRIATAMEDHLAAIEAAPTSDILDLIARR